MNPPRLPSHPRLLAALVALLAGNAFMPIFVWQTRFPLGHGKDFFFNLAFCEIVVLVTAAWSFAVFGASVSSARRSIPAISLGALCPALGMATVFTGASVANWTSGSGHRTVSGALDELLWAAIFPAFLGSVLTLFLPELIGAFSGYVIWRLARSWAAT